MPFHRIYFLRCGTFLKFFRVIYLHFLMAIHNGTSIHPGAPIHSGPPNHLGTSIHPGSSIHPGPLFHPVPHIQSIPSDEFNIAYLPYRSQSPHTLQSPPQPVHLSLFPFEFARRRLKLCKHFYLQSIEETKD